MRCVGCEIDPLASADYCECCGRRLSLHELHQTKAFGPAPVLEPHDSAPEPSPAADARCESCGGPSADGNLCQPCQLAFSSWLGTTEPAAPALIAPTAPAPVAPAAPAAVAAVEESLWSQLMNSPAPPANDPFYTATPAEVEVEVELTASAPVLPEATMVSVHEEATAAKAEVVRVPKAVTEPVKAEAAKAEAPQPAPQTQVQTPQPPQTQAAKIEVAQPKEAKVEPPRVPQALKPPVANKRPNVAVPPKHQRHRIVLAAAAVVVAGIGIGAYWLRTHEQTLVAKDVTVAELQPPASELPEAITETKTRKPAAPPQAPGPARQRPTTSAPSAGVVSAQPSAKSVRSSGPSIRQIWSASTPNPAIEAPAPVVAPPAPDVIATAPSPAAPSGPFFEAVDVNESPRVATRVEPQLPDELRARPLNEIVIVRALVSQSGHPFRISLLRRSKAGPRLDSAVIAAVNQWTFSPARKRGEAVSCWLNFGVPVGRAD